MTTRRDLTAEAGEAAAKINERWWREATLSELDLLTSDLTEETCAGVFTHIQRRRRLALPRLDCTAKRRLFDLRPKCFCLTEALDEAPEASSRDEVLAISSRRHRSWSRRYPRRRKRRVPKGGPQLDLVADERPVRVPIAALPPGDSPPRPYEPPQERSTHRRVRREPVHPLSWAATTQSPEISTRDLLEKDF